MFKKAIGTITAFAICIVSATSCGAKEYQTLHKTATYKVNSFEDLEKLFFEPRSSINKVARVFSDFSYYNAEKMYKSVVPVDFSGFFEEEGIFSVYSKDSEEWVTVKYSDVKDNAKLPENLEITIEFNLDKEFTKWYLDYNLYSGGHLCASGLELFCPTLAVKYEENIIGNDKLAEGAFLDGYHELDVGNGELSISNDYIKAKLSGNYTTVYKSSIYYYPKEEKK